MAQMLHRIATNQNNNIMNRLFIIVAFVATIVGCSTERRWGIEERRALREDIRTLRDMAYLDNLTEVEFDTFAGDVIEAIEIDYPVYTTFVELPAVNDTVQVYVLTTIVEQLNTDARKMRHLFPYNSLVQTNVLPSGLDRTEQNAFYRCLAQRVNNTYPTIDSFVNAVVSDTTSMSTITQLQQQCANDLFGWQVDIVEIVESN